MTQCVMRKRKLRVLGSATSMRLKLLRKKLGVTLEALAEGTGLSKSYLSKVERGLNNPSIAAALKLAKALNVQVEELFSDEPGTQQSYSIVRAEQRGTLTHDNDGLSYASLARRVSEHQLLPFMLYPNTEFNHSAFKEHMGEEFLFVHRGQVEIDFMTERVTLNTGDALHFDAQRPHRIRSLGDSTAELLVVVDGHV
ncbi:helix-turn-helix domain-containing protein [Halomonas elongata]|uniref:helix-turn-helix domain-containing protein n=2 Tax=Halomonas elongata TaxID=2746 RepID=UPI00186B5DFD|nr:XRE family transcriptional regulator [Halomonas elongata]MBW5801718.1 XRE family transcriptional regulator [Halomonas elongata]WVI70139.1 XRE family transcriptional regulator [Halomonas elongata]